MVGGEGGRSRSRSPAAAAADAVGAASSRLTTRRTGRKKSGAANVDPALSPSRGTVSAGGGCSNDGNVKGVRTLRGLENVCGSVEVTAPKMIMKGDKGSGSTKLGVVSSSQGGQDEVAGGDEETPPECVQS